MEKIIVSHVVSVNNINNEIDEDIGINHEPIDIQDTNGDSEIQQGTTIVKHEEGYTVTSVSSVLEKPSTSVIKRQLKDDKTKQNVNKKHICSYCNKCFKTLSKRDVHERTHTGQKPYSCSYCNKTFSVSANKVSHERTHTGVETLFM